MEALLITQSLNLALRKTADLHVVNSSYVLSHMVCSNCDTVVSRRLRFMWKVIKPRERWTLICSREYMCD